MATLKVTGSKTSVSLDSYWRCGKANIEKEIEVNVQKEREETKKGERTIVTPEGRTVKVPYEYKVSVTYTTGVKAKKYVVEDKIVYGPDTGVDVVSFDYSLPSGVIINSAKILCSSSVGVGGSSVLTANGNQIKDGVADISLSENSGTINVTFAYKSGGKIYSNSDQQKATTILSGISLSIEYGYPLLTSRDNSSSSVFDDVYLSPPQSICIIDQTNDSIYTFDGVPKIQHNLTTDIQEEPDKPKEYVNNAKNEPDKLTIDVLMSDVYTGGTDITIDGLMTTDQQNALEKSKNAIIQDGTTRSQIFFYALHWLKEQRRRLTVITPQYVHTDMIIASVTVNQDDMTPFGWEGQIAFQHAFAKKPKPTSKKSSAGDGKGTSTTSVSAVLLGCVDQNGKSIVDTTTKGG